MVHNFSPNTWETEADRLLSSRSAELVLGQSGLHRVTVSKANKNPKQTIQCSMLEAVSSFLHHKAEKGWAARAVASGKLKMMILGGWSSEFESSLGYIASFRPERPHLSKKKKVTV